MQWLETAVKNKLLKNKLNRFKALLEMSMIVS